MNTHMDSEILANKNDSQRQGDNDLSISETVGSVNHAGNTKISNIAFVDHSKML